MKTFHESIIPKPMIPNLGEPNSNITQPIQPKKLPKSVVQILTERIVDEYNAYFLYRNAANWCKDANYKKAAAFFEKEAEGEL
jgi:Ferritin-like domain